MTGRMAPLDRMLQLVHMLAESAEGLTLDEMATGLGVNRRTAERMRDVVALHFDLDEIADERRKRFRIGGSLRRVFTRPNAAEIAALQTEAETQKRAGGPQAALLESLLLKLKGTLDDREKRRLDPDLDPLVRLQRGRALPGPALDIAPEALAVIQGAMMAAHGVEFDYRPDGAAESSWRRVVPYGLIHGPITYLVGKIPGDRPPVPFRLDRMDNVRQSDLPGAPPEDWSLDAWTAQSFGIWREDDYDVVLRVLPWAVPQARAWRFHPAQTVDEDGECLIVRFRAGGLREMAHHLFTWDGGIVIEGPEELRSEFAARIEAARTALDR